MKKINNMFIVLATAMFYLALETPIYAGFNPGKQGKGVFLFNVAIVLVIIGFAGWIMWKKKNGGDDGGDE